MSLFTLNKELEVNTNYGYLRIDIIMDEWLNNSLPKDFKLVGYWGNKEYKSGIKSMNVSTNWICLVELKFKGIGFQPFSLVVVDKQPFLEYNKNIKEAHELEPGDMITAIAGGMILEDIGIYKMGDIFPVFIDLITEDPLPTVMINNMFFCEMREKIREI